VKIILSRKGFDSTFGGCPSPIFPDRTMLSLPIPDSHDKATIRYCDLKSPLAEFPHVGEIVAQLTGGRISANDHAHLDPHLDRQVYSVSEAWRALFGQDGAAQGVLRNQKVGKGDLFLFYGLYREVVTENGRIRFCTKAQKRHVIFGWMSIGEVVPIEELTDAARWLKEHPWAAYHSHFQYGNKVKNNTLYVAAENCFHGLPGSGVFPKYSAKQCLTAVGESCSVWLLPKWFDPHRCRTPLSYNNNRAKWEKKSEGWHLKTKTPGQEYVLDADVYSEAKGWAKELIATCV
jgi:hypothetical protein